MKKMASIPFKPVIYYQRKIVQSHRNRPSVLKVVAINIRKEPKVDFRRGRSMHVDQICDAFSNIFAIYASIDHWPVRFVIRLAKW